MVPSCLAVKTLTKNIGFANTAFCEFLVISNKNIAPFIKFNYGYNEQCFYF